MSGIWEVFGIFQPGIEHLRAEQERLRHGRVEVGDADPPWAVDLDAGTVTLPATAGQQARATEPGNDVRQPGGPVHRPLQQVGPGVWTTTAEKWTTQTTVVVAEDRTCLVVDPALTPEEVLALADELTLRGWRPVAGFSTHPHWDHVLWHRALGDVPRFATAAGARAAAEQRRVLAEEADQVAPGHDHTLTGALTPLPDGVVELPWDGPRVVVVPYPGHCTGSAALVVPSAGVMVAGDMLSDIEPPLPDEEAADPVGDYRESLDLLEAVVTEHGVRTLVPGHGHVADADELARRLAADRARIET